MHPLSCPGLDPRPELLPPALIRDCIAAHGPGREGVAEAFRRFNAAILAAVAGHCAAVKFQVACYEAYGWQGMRALEDGIAAARTLGIPVIVDGKRNDIGSTATHYQQAWLGAAPGLDAQPVAAVRAMRTPGEQHARFATPVPAFPMRNPRFDRCANSTCAPTCSTPPASSSSPIWSARASARSCT